MTFDPRFDSLDPCPVCELGPVAGGHADGCPWPDSLGGRIEAIETAARRLGVDVSAKVKRIRDRNHREFLRVWRRTR